MSKNYAGIYRFIFFVNSQLDIIYKNYNIKLLYKLLFALKAGSIKTKIYSFDDWLVRKKFMYHLVV